MKSNLLKAALIAGLLAASGLWADEAGRVEPQSAFAAILDETGWNPPRQVYSLQNTSSDWIVWHARADAGLVVCLPPSGWLASGQVVAVTVAPAPGAAVQPAGTYSDNITFDWQIRILSDVNGDGVVDVIDLLEMQATFGSTAGDPNYDALCDFDSDNLVGTTDLLELIGMFGQ